MKKVAAKKTITYETRKDMFMDNPVKETAKRPKSIITVCNLVDEWIDEKITQDELVEKLMIVVGKPIIKVSEIEFIVTEWKGNIYLESRQEMTNGCRDNWVQVEDLCDLTVCEYNCLVTQLHEVYPDYPIEHLEGRFV